MNSRSESKEELSFLKSLYNLLVRETLIPLFLMISIPNLILLFSNIIINENSDMKITLMLDSVEDTLWEAWKSVKWFDVYNFQKDNVLNDISLLKIGMIWKVGQ